MIIGRWRNSDYGMFNECAEDLEVNVDCRHIGLIISN